MGKIYKVGSLQYTLPQLLVTMFWLLLGVFWYDMVQYILIPQLMPLSFKSLGASNSLIGLVTGSIPWLLNLVLNPIISTASDRYRSRWGRRIPFMAVSIPFITFFCIVLGWLPEFRTELAQLFPNADQTNLMLFLYSVALTLFTVSSLLIGIVSSYLTPDVIPQMFIGRFQIAKGLVMNAAAFLFTYFLMQYVEDAAKWLYTGIALAFALCFTLTCIFIKEGDYPPPEIPQKTAPLPVRIKNWITLYFKECYSKPFYLIIFFGYAMTSISTLCRITFNILFATKDLGISIADYGKIAAYSSIPCVILLFVLSTFVDKLNPLLLYTFSGVLVIILNVFGYYFVYDYNSFFIVGILMGLVYTVQGVAANPMTIMLFPREKYGQFCSAMMLVTCFFSVVGNWLCGLMVDWFGYRFIYTWDFIFTIIATVFLLEVYRRWRIMKKNGIDPTASIK